MAKDYPVSAPDAQTAKRVAVLVDGDNISQDLAGQIIMRSLGVGDLIVKRVYGNALNLPKWDAAPGFRLVHAGAGKNATDMLLAIEAVDLASKGQLDAFVIATSDRDFTHLAHHLRERGLTVVGMGEAKTPESFRKACTKFRELGPVAPTESVQVPPPKPDQATLDQKLIELIKSQGDGSGLALVKVNPAMLRYGFKISETPEKQWRTYFEKRESLFHCDPRGPEARVRLKAP